MKRFYKFLMPLVAIVALALPVRVMAQDTVTIGTGTSTSYYIPFNSLYGYSFTEMVYQASDIDMPGQITAVQFYLGTSNSTAQTNNITLYMKSVTRSTFSSSSDFEAVTASDIVYSGSWTIPANYTGWVNIELDTPFDYDGVSNLMVAMHESTSGYSSRYFTYTSVTGAAVQLYSDSYNPDPYNTSSYSGSSTTRNYLANMRLAITNGTITCNRVRNLTATDIAPWSCTLNWIDTLNSGASYTVITMPDSTIMASGISDTTVSLSGLTPDHSYIFGVITDCGGGDESRATTVNVHTLVSCPNPTQLTLDSITPTNAYIHWTPGFSETEWYLTIGDSVVGSITDTFYTITDLTPNTVYNLHLRAVCGADDSSIVTSLAIHTLAGEPISTFPYTCGFEVTDDGDEAADWILENGSQTNKWFVGTPGAHNGTKGLFVSDNNGTSNSYSNSSTSHVYAYAVFNFSEVGEYMISYDWKNQGESNSYDWLRVFMAPASQDFVAGSAQPLGTSTYSACTTAVAPGWFELTGRTTSPYTLAQSSTWQNVVTTFTITNPGTYKLVFMWSNDGSGGSNPPASVDNISISLNTCPAPVDLTIDSLMPTSIDLHWTAIGEETEWALQVGDTLITGITDTNYTVTGLDQYTLYTMRVYAVCDAGDTSLPTPSVTGRTTVSCPWPVSVTATATGGDTVMVTWAAGTGTSSTDFYLVYGPSGFNPASVDQSNWISASGVTSYEITGLTAGLYDVYVRCDCGGDDGISAWGGPATVGLGYMNIDQVDTLYTCGVIICDDGGPTGNYTASRNDQVVIYPVDNMHGLTITGNSYTEGSYDYVTIYEGVGTSGTILFQDNTSGVSSQLTVGPFDVEGPITITFHSDGSVYYDGFQIRVTCYDLGGCTRPSNLVCTSTTPDSVAINWNGNGAAGWDVFVGPAGAMPNADSAIAVTDSNYVFTNLSGGVAYDIYVRSDCGGDQSDWRGPLTVTPGTYVIGTSGSATISMCGGVIYDDGGATGQYSNSADFVLTVYPSHPDSMLTFYGTLAHESCCDHLYIYEGVGDGGNLLWSDQSIATNQTIPLDTCVSGPITIKWHADGSNVNAGFEIFVNCVAAPQCSPVEALTVKPTPTAALVTWQPGYYGNYTGADIEYKADTSETWISLPAVTGTYAVITGLDPVTDYNVRVTTDCDGFPGGVATANFTSANYGCLVADSTGSRTVTVGTGSSTSSYFPTYSCYNYSLSEQVFTPTELGGGGNLVSMTMTPTSVVSANRSVEIYLGHVSSNTLSNFVYPTDLTLVYTGTTNLVANQPYTFTLDNAFMYNGSDNLLVLFRDMTGSYSCSNSWAATSSTSGVSRYVYQDSGPYSLGYTGGTSSSDRANTTFNFLSCAQYASCAAPAATVVDVTTTTATVVWAPGSGEASWNVYYRLAGDASWSAPTAVTVNSHTFTGLLAGRRYEFKVENACSEGDFATTTNATTLCAQISSLPFTENFNGWGTGVTPNCWSNAGSYSPASYGIISSSYNMSGSTGGSIYMYSSSTLSNKTYISLPELDTTVYQPNQLQLVFNLFYTSTSYGRPAIEVGVMSDPNNPSSFVVVDTVQHSGALSTWEVFEVPMAGYTGNGSYVAMRTAFDSAYSYFYLDDLTLEVIPTCPRPDSLTASNATTNSVDLAWHERGAATTWIIEYGPAGFELGTGTQVVANSNPFTLTGLTASYQGEYYVKSICGAGDTGEFSRMPCGFNTTQVPATLPYNYDFENPAEWANWQISSNDETKTWYRGTDVADGGSYSMYVAASDTGYYSYAFDAVVNATAYRDIDFGPIDSSYTLSFSARAGGTTDARYDALMVFLVDPSLPATASTGNITTPWGNVNDLYRIATIYLDTNWQTYEASFDTISGVQRVAFFWFNQNTGASYANIPQPGAVDNIHIDYSSCPRPVNVEITPNSTSAMVTWQAEANANYQVIYREYPGAHPNTFVTANTNQITLTGLTANTQYAVWVRKLCSANDTSLASDGYLFTTTICDGGTEAHNYTTEATTTTDYGPIGYSNYNYSYVQTIIDSADLASLNGDITAFAFLPTNTEANSYFNNMTVYMSNISETSLTDFIHPDATHVFTKVIDSASFNFTDAVWQIHDLDTAFTWDGHSNLLISVKRDNGVYTCCTEFAAHSASGNKMCYAYRDTDPYDLNYSGGTTTSTVADIRLISCGSCSAPSVNVTNITYESATVTAGGNGLSYEFAYGTDPNSLGAIQTSTTGIFNLTGLTPATQYFYQMRQNCVENEVSGWTEGFFSTDSLPCIAVSNVQITDVTYNSVSVSWTVNGDEHNWEVMVYSTVDTHTVTVQTAAATVGDLMPQRLYNVNVRPMCGSNGNIEGPWLDTAMQVTTSACQPVTDVTVTPGATMATVAWTAPAGASNFRVIYGAPDFGVGDEYGTYNTNDNPFVLTDLEANTPYTVRVANVCTESLVSQWTSADFTTTNVGINGAELDGALSLFPNPASTMVTLRVSEQMVGSTVSIVDVNGRVSGEWRVENGELTIDVSDLAKGAYFVRITGEQTTVVRKLIVE